MGFWEDFFRRFSHLKRYFSYLLSFFSRSSSYGNVPCSLHGDMQDSSGPQPGGYRFGVLVGVALFCLIAGGIAGFFLGPAVQASVSEPGSSDDPLVSRSYVDEKLGDYLEDLEAEIEQLRNQTLELEEELEKLR